MADLVVGFIAMYFAGAFFEGYVLSRVSTSLAFMLVIAPIGKRLIQFAAERGGVHAPSPLDTWAEDPEFVDLADSYGRDGEPSPGDTHAA